jgi:hypothetical protein
MDAISSSLRGYARGAMLKLLMTSSKKWVPGFRDFEQSYRAPLPSLSENRVAKHLMRYRHHVPTK